MRRTGRIKQGMKDTRGGQGRRGAPTHVPVVRTPTGSAPARAFGSAALLLRACIMALLPRAMRSSALRGLAKCRAVERLPHAPPSRSPVERRRSRATGGALRSRRPGAAPVLQRLPDRSTSRACRSASFLNARASASLRTAFTIASLSTAFTTASLRAAWTNAASGRPRVESRQRYTYGRNLDCGPHGGIVHRGPRHWHRPSRPACLPPPLRRARRCRSSRRAGRCRPWHPRTAASANAARTAGSASAARALASDNRRATTSLCRNSCVACRQA